jgi:hypothetical protein
MLLLGIAAAPAGAAPCTTTTLNNILGTTCDIGTLEYTFGLRGFTFTNLKGALSLAPSYFTFTPGASDFTISGNAVSVTNGDYARAILHYSIVALAGSLTSITVACGSLADSSPTGGFADCENSLLTPHDAQSLDSIQTATTAATPALCDPTIAAGNCSGGNGDLNIFFMQAPPSGTASWDPFTTAAFQTTGVLSVPEPSPLLVLGSALMIWLLPTRIRRLGRSPRTTYLESRRR